MTDREAMNKALDDAIGAQIQKNIHVDNTPPVEVDIDYLDDPMIPKGRAIGFYGRGESGKSTVAATICAENSHNYSTLWVSSEEPADHIKTRHSRCGAEVNTIGVVTGGEFDVTTHLLAAIVKARNMLSKPLGFVVLDAIVTLVTWENKSGPNDDAAVKKLLSFIDQTAQSEGVSILLIGHLNKGKGHAHMADAVLGATAWTSSLRLAYLLRKVPDQDYVGFLRTAKSNLSAHFGAFYKTTPVHQMKANVDGYRPTLCKIEWQGERIYGERELTLAMGESGDEETKKLNKRESRINEIAEDIVDILKDGDKKNRSTICHVLDTNITGREWTSIEPILRDRNVTISHGERNRMHYQLCKDTPPQ